MKSKILLLFLLCAFLKGFSYSDAVYDASGGTYTGDSNLAISNQNLDGNGTNIWCAVDILQPDEGPDHIDFVEGYFTLTGHTQPPPFPSPYVFYNYSDWDPDFMDYFNLVVPDISYTSIFLEVWAYYSDSSYEYITIYRAP